MIKLLCILSLGCCIASRDARAEICSAEAADRAKIYYNDGAARYRLGEFADAADLFKKSYEACQSTKLLYNIGQTYRLAKDNEKALFFYKQYLSAAPPDDPYRAEVQALIDKLESQRAHEKAPVQTSQSSITPAVNSEVRSTDSAGVQLVHSQPPSPPHKPLYKKGWFWGVVVGSAVVIGGVVGLTVGLTQRTSYPSETPSNGTFQF